MQLEKCEGGVGTVPDLSPVGRDLAWAQARLEELARQKEELRTRVDGQQRHLETLKEQLDVSRRASRALTEQLYETQDRLARLEALGPIPLRVARKLRALLDRFPRVVGTLKRIRRLVG